MNKSPRQVALSALLIGMIGGLLGSAPPSAASHGGPELAEILGWNPEEQKVFCRVTYLDEAHRAPGIFYVDLKNGSSLRWQQVAWSRGVDEGSTYLAHARSLERHLRPLRPIVATTIPEFRAVVGIDTLRDEHIGSIVRYRVLIGDGFLGSYLLVTTLVEPYATVIRQYEIPGRPERIGIVAYRGVPLETIYETQVPFVFHGAADTIRVVRPLREYETDR